MSWSIVSLADSYIEAIILLALLWLLVVSTTAFLWPRPLSGPLLRSEAYLSAARSRLSAEWRSHYVRSDSAQSWSSTYRSSTQ